MFVVIACAAIVSLIITIIVFCGDKDEKKEEKKWKVWCWGAVFAVIIFVVISFYGFLIHSIITKERQRRELNEQRTEQAIYALNKFIYEELEGNLPPEMWYLPRNSSNRFLSARVTTEFYENFFVWMTGQDFDFSLNHAREAIEHGRFNISPFLSLD